MTPFDNEIDQLLTQAEEMLQKERPTEALSFLERARKLQPRHAWTMLFRGVALGQLGQLEEAVDQLISAADEHAGDIDIQVDAARHLSLLEQYQDALICARRALELDEHDAGAHAVCGEVLERLDRIEEAVPHREQALEYDNDDIDSRYYLAVDLCDLERYEEGHAIAEPLFASFADDPDIIRLHGACQSYLGQHQEALICWAELERLEGITPNLLHNRASTLDVLGLHEEALATISEAIALEPDAPLNYYTRGMIHEHGQDEAAAIDDYLAALTCDAEYLDAIVNLIELAVSSDVAPEILARIRQLLPTDPPSAKLRYAEGRLLMEMGELEQANALLQSAVSREPALGIAWYALMLLYGMQGDYAGVLAASDYAMRFFAEDEGLWFNRGLALHELKRYPEAMDAYDRAATLAQDDPLPLLQTARLLLFDLDRPFDARGILREVLSLQPENQSALWMLGLASLRLDKRQDAVDMLAQLLADAPDYLWGRLVRAALHVQSSEHDEALEDLAVAVEQGYDLRLLLNEPLFAPLWNDPRFTTMFRQPDGPETAGQAQDDSRQPGDVC